MNATGRVMKRISSNRLDRFIPEMGNNKNIDKTGKLIYLWVYSLHAMCRCFFLMESKWILISCFASAS